jgi:hypothetical protein
MYVLGIKKGTEPRMIHPTVNYNFHSEATALSCRIQTFQIFHFFEAMSFCRSNSCAPYTSQCASLFDIPTHDFIGINGILGSMGYWNQ